MSSADIRGRFVWHELMTSDTDAAGDFYSNVVAWKTQDSGMPSYTLWMAGGHRAAGLMALPEQDGSATPPHWIIYIGTPDVEATAAAAERLGGRVLKPAADIPGVGRFAVLSDPQGAAFAVFNPQAGSSDAPPGGEVGDFTWHELATTDPESAFRFYSELFGWAKGAAHDMGEMGVYQLLSHGGSDVAGIFKARDNSTPPAWLSYVRVADAAKAVSAAKSAGGRVLNGPMEVPGGSWIAQLLDPQGGAFAVVEAPKPKAAAAPARAAKKAPAAKAPAAKAPAERAAPAKTAAKVAPPKTAPKKPAAKPAAGKAAARKSPAKKAPSKKVPAKTAPAAKSAARGKVATGKKGGSGKRPAMAKKPKRAATKSARRPAVSPVRGKSVRAKSGGKARGKK